MKNRLATSLVSFAIAALMLSFNAVAGPNDGPSTRSTTPASLLPNQGGVWCTAAVNADGTNAQITGGSAVLSTTKLAGFTGAYEVQFKPPCNSITAVRGFARFVQVDTLEINEAAGYCTTADRVGKVNGVFVQCYDSTGAKADQSFFLFVTR